MKRHERTEHAFHAQRSAFPTPSLPCHAADRGEAAGWRRYQLSVPFTPRPCSGAPSVSRRSASRPRLNAWPKVWNGYGRFDAPAVELISRDQLVGELTPGDAPGNDQATPS